MESVGAPLAQVPDEIDAVPVRQPEIRQQHVGEGASQCGPRLGEGRYRSGQTEVGMAVHDRRQPGARVIVVLHQEHGVLSGLVRGHAAPFYVVSGCARLP